MTLTPLLIALAFAAGMAAGILLREAFHRASLNAGGDE